MKVTYVCGTIFVSASATAYVIGSTLSLTGQLSNQKNLGALLN